MFLRMETAPRDGTPFWGIVDNDAIYMFWHERFKAFISPYRRMEVAPGYLINGQQFEDHSPTIRYPSAWVPLPVDLGSEGSFPKLPPDRVQMPENEEQARAMILIAENFLKAHGGA
jgi:hypothetical protein